MPDKNHVPIIFLAFANRDDSTDYLRNLPDEIHGITAALKSAKEKGLCAVIERVYVTLDDVFNVFLEYKNQIVAFHFGGHADSFNLILQNSSAHKDGFMPFLANQKGLSLVFLNGCSTAEQSRELVAAGIPAVIGTNTDICDKVAADLAIRFYKGIAAGSNIKDAWLDAENFVKTKKGDYSARNFRRPHLEGQKENPEGFPWQVTYDKSHPETLQWKLSPVVKPIVYSDIYSRYEQGMEKLLEQLGTDHPQFSHATMLQARLTDNLAKTRTYGENQSRMSERMEIIDQLNRLALPILGQSFNQLCK